MENGDSNVTIFCNKTSSTLPSRDFHSTIALQLDLNKYIMYNRTLLLIVNPICNYYKKLIFTRNLFYIGCSTIQLNTVS